MPAWAALLQKGLIEAAVLGAVAVAVFLLLALITYNTADPGWTHVGGVKDAQNAAGSAGAFAADLLLTIFGYLAYLFPLLVGFWGVRVFRERRASHQAQLSWPMFALRLLGLVMIMVAGSALLQPIIQQDFLPNGAGGILGAMVGGFAYPSFGRAGGTLILFVLLMLAITLYASVSWISLTEKLGALVMSSIERVRNTWEQWRLNVAEKKEQQAAAKAKAPEKKKTIAIGRIDDLDPPVKTTGMEKAKEAVKKATKKASVAITPMAAKPELSEKAKKAQQKNLFPDTETDGLPPLSLLDPPDEDGRGGFTDADLENMSRLLETKLADFKVSAEVVAVQPGPVITRFEVQPAPGIKASRITGLAQDLARSLAVISVRVVEVIPGKTTVGIEIPNEKREIIRFVEAVGSKLFDESKSALTMALGKDISGNPVIADLSTMPHLLVAGTTGSGKSVGLNAMLLSMLFKSSPEEVRLIMIDPKMLELAVYDGIPHLLTPVVTDMTEAASALRWGVAEMERRYRLMAALGVRNLAGFNRKVKDANEAGEPISDPTWQPSNDGLSDEPEEAPLLTHLPSIVIVIDEFADMMMIVGKKVEELIARIAQKARAAGIHLILATQRPSVDVITGLIKANVPSRMAFQVSSRIDSRTILDQGGAEQLLGYGDMLYLPVGVNVPERVHGAFVSDDEVHRVCDDWRQRGEPNYLPEILEDTDINAAIPGMEGPGDSDDAESDPLYDEAVAHVIESRRASISFVQRKMRIGYNRAARLVEAMEAAGIVSAPGHNGQREVVVPGGDR